MKKLDLSSYAFEDTEFQSKDDKAKVLRDWERFLRLGMEFKNFSKRLYKHLTLHCSFIAHYGREGFYGTYFQRPEATIKFLSQFDRNHAAQGLRSVEYSHTYWLTDRRYHDINVAMVDIGSIYAPLFYEGLVSAAKGRDLAQARALLTKWDQPIPEQARPAAVPTQATLF